MNGITLITGGAGFLGRATARKACEQGRRCVSISRHGGRNVLAHDLLDWPFTKGLLRTLRPAAIIHLAALSRPEQAQRSPDAARAINFGVTANLVSWAQDNGAHFVFASTDHVFDGTKGGYREVDAPGPINVYGRTKLLGEEAVSARDGVVLRMGWLLEDDDRTPGSFWCASLAKLSHGETVRAVVDERRSSATVEQAAEILLNLVSGRNTGVRHLVGIDGSPYDLLRTAAAAKGLDPDLIKPASRSELGICPRPADVTLASRFRSSCGESQASS